jgi:anti-sigma factor RsiW
MKCERARSRMDAYLDSQLDGPSSAELESHLRSCRSCEPLLLEGRRLRELYRGDLPRFTAPAGLSDRIRTTIRGESRRSSYSSLWWLSAAAVAAAVCLLILFHAGPEQQIRVDAVRAFARAQLTNHFCDITSADAAVVQSWLQAKLQYSPPVVDVPDYEMRGGRIEKIRDRTVAAIVYRRHKQIINVFIWPTLARESLKPAYWSDKNCSACVWSRDRLSYAAVGNVSPQEMDEFEDQFRDELEHAGG